MESNNSVSSETSAKSTPAKNNFSISKDEYQIYSQLINDDKTLTGYNVLIYNKTTIGDVKPMSTLAEVVSVLRKTPETSKFGNLIDDFELKNKDSYEILDNLNINCCQYKIGNNNENAQNVGTIIKFSRIGFDENKQFAILYFEQYHGLKSAFGKYLILKKENEKWEIQKINLPEWVS